MDRVLIVDDERFIRALLVNLLEGEGYSCTTAEGVTEAREQLAANGFDLVLSDIDMPDGSGLDLAAEALGSGGKTAVILMTGITDSRLAAEAVNLGVHGYLLKPFRLDEVRVRIAEALNRAGIAQR